MTVYRIADVVFNPDACELTASGETQHVQPQVRNVLLSLVRHEGEVVPKDLLVEEAWHGRRTSDESVTRCISLLRRHFDSGGDRQLIETIPKVGYRLRGPVAVEKERTTQADGYFDYASDHADVPPKTTVNLMVTAAVIFILLSGLLVASDFFALSR